jgi:hypothetical protein
LVHFLYHLRVLKEDHIQSTKYLFIFIAFSETPG